MAVNRGHGDLIQPDLVDQLIEFLAPAVMDILSRIDADEFTTVQFIDVMLTDPDAERLYQEALARWGEDENYSKMVIHGQVIPAILRRIPVVSWAGYAHGERDDYAVPAWWRVTSH